MQRSKSGLALYAAGELTRALSVFQFGFQLIETISKKRSRFLGKLRFELARRRTSQGADRVSLQ